MKENIRWNFSRKPKKGKRKTEKELRTRLIEAEIRNSQKYKHELL